MARELLDIFNAEQYENSNFLTHTLINEIVGAVRIRLRCTQSGNIQILADFGTGTFIEWGIIQFVNYTLPLSGIVDSIVNLKGELRNVSTGNTVGNNTRLSVLNQHFCINVTSITGTATFRIQGTSVSEDKQTPVPGDFEEIFVDGTGRYQTSKKWLEKTDIIITGSYSGLLYDEDICGYVDFGNNNTYILGARCDIKSQANTADITFRLIKVKDNGNNKFELQDLESIGIDSNIGNGSIVDNVRTGVDDRSYTFSNTAFPSDSMLVFKMTDYFEFFQADKRYEVLGADRDEGIVLRMEGSPIGTGITGIDHISVDLAIIKR